METKSFIHASGGALPFLTAPNDGPEMTQILKLSSEDGSVYIYPDTDEDGNDVVAIEHENALPDDTGELLEACGLTHRKG